MAASGGVPVPAQIEHVVGAQPLAAGQHHGTRRIDRAHVGVAHVKPGGESSQGAPHADRAGLGVQQPRLPCRTVAHHRDALRDAVGVQRLPRRPDGVHRRGAQIGGVAPGDDQPLLPQQPTGAQLALPAPPARPRPQGQLGQPRRAVGDPEDARQPSRLLGAEARALQHGDLSAAAGELVAGGQPADSGPDDEDAGQTPTPM